MEVPSGLDSGRYPRQGEGVINPAGLFYDACGYQGEVVQEPLLLTIEECADRLRVGRTRMFALISGGQIETVTIGRSRRIPASALAAYVDRLRAEQAAA